MRDIDVRNALHRRVLREHNNDPHTIVLNEFGLCHGKCRVDVAVVNGSLHGFELKSDRDTLARLPSQVAIYSRVLDRATLVVGERHAAKAIPELPHWWGVKVAQIGRREGISFLTTRPAFDNPGIEPVSLAQLLWRDEVTALLSTNGLTGAALRRPRKFLYEALADTLGLADLREAVRTCLKARENWRGQKPFL